MLSKNRTPLVDFHEGCSIMFKAERTLAMLKPYCETLAEHHHHLPTSQAVYLLVPLALR